MSKNLPIKNQAALEKTNTPFRDIREVTPLMQKPQHEMALRQGEIVTAYKDLNHEKNQSLLNQQRHLTIAFSAFLLLGLGIYMGTHYSKSRSIASADFKGFPATVNPTHVEQYHYDKSCYTGENGEQVCMTRTSRK